MKYLRELAKEFAQGKINQDEYRKQRTGLIQGILAGDIQVPDHDYLAPLPPPTEDDITAQGFEYDPLATTEIAVTKPGKKKQSRPSATAEPANTDKPFPLWLFAILSIAVLVLIISITALFIFTSSNDDAVPESQSAVRTPLAGEAAGKLIRIFIEQNNWQEHSLKQFEENWQKIGPAEQQAAADLPVMNLMKDSIQKQILEVRRAMTALGDVDAARRKQQILVDFARNIGINDPAIAVSP